MADRFVSKTYGNNANGGTDPITDAWLTCDHAASNVTSGPNKIHTEHGIYRELVTLDGSGSSGNTIDWEADLTGEYWPNNPGPTYITASDDELANTRTGALIVSSRSFHTFTGFAFMYGSVNPIGVGSTATDFVFDRCLFVHSSSNILQANAAINNLTVRHSVVSCTTGFMPAQTYSNALFEDNVFWGAGCWSSSAATASSTIRRNLFLGATGNATPTTFLRNAGATTGFELLVYDNLFTVNCFFQVTAGNPEGIIENNNKIIGSRTVTAGTITQGANTVAGVKPVFRHPTGVLNAFGEMLYADWSDDNTTATTLPDFFGNSRLSGGPVDVGPFRKLRESLVSL